jgi:hypothetical protein
MAQLQNSVVSGNLRVTDTTFASTIQANIINAPTSSNAATYGPGTNGQVLKSNGTSLYWGTDENHTGYVAINQGAGNAGKFLVVNSSGVVAPASL